MGICRFPKPQSQPELPELSERQGQQRHQSPRPYSMEQIQIRQPDQNLYSNVAAKNQLKKFYRWRRDTLISPFSVTQLNEQIHFEKELSIDKKNYRKVFIFLIEKQSFIQEINNSNIASYEFSRMLQAYHKNGFNIQLTYNGQVIEYNNNKTINDIWPNEQFIELIALYKNIQLEQQFQQQETNKLISLIIQDRYKIILNESFNIKDKIINDYLKNRLNKKFFLYYENTVINENDTFESVFPNKECCKLYIFYPQKIQSVEGSINLSLLKFEEIIKTVSIDSKQQIYPIIRDMYAEEECFVFKSKKLIAQTAKFQIAFKGQKDVCIINQQKLQHLQQCLKAYENTVDSIKGQIKKLKNQNQSFKNHQVNEKNSYYFYFQHKSLFKHQILNDFGNGIEQYIQSNTLQFTNTDTFQKYFDYLYKGILIKEKQIVPRYVENINKSKIDRKLYVIHEKNKFYQTYEETYKKVIKAHAMSKVGENCKIYHQNQEFNERVNYQDAFNNQINLFELFFLEEKKNQKQFVCIYSNVGLINIEFQNHPIIKRPQILQIQSINNQAGNLIDKILDRNLQNKKYGCLCKFGILNQFDSFDQLGLNSDFISIVVIPIPDFNIPDSASKVLVRFFTIYQCQSQETYSIQTKIRNTINCQQYILLISGKVIKNIDAYLYDCLPQNAKELNITLFEIRGLKPQQNDPLYLDIFYEEFLQNINKQLQEQIYLEIQNLKNNWYFKKNLDLKKKQYNNVNNENLILIHFKNKFFQTLSNENKNSSIQLYADQQLQDNNVAVYYKNEEIGNLKEKRFLDAFPTQELTELYVFKREKFKVQVCIYSNSQIKQIGEIFRPKIICIESVDRNCSFEDFSQYYNFPYCFLSKFGVLNGIDRFNELCQGVDMCHLILLPYPDQETKTALEEDNVYVMFWEFGQPYNEGKQNGYFTYYIRLRQLLDNQEFQIVINGRVVQNLDAQLGQFILKTTLQLNITLVKVQKIKEQVKNQPIFAELLLTSFVKEVLNMQNIDQVNALSPVFKIELQANQ